MKVLISLNSAKHIRAALGIDYTRFKDIKPIKGWIMTKLGWCCTSLVTIPDSYSSPKEYFDSLDFQGIPISYIDTLITHTQSLQGIPNSVRSLCIRGYNKPKFDYPINLTSPIVYLSFTDCNNIVNFEGAIGKNRVDRLRVSIIHCSKLESLKGLPTTLYSLKCSELNLKELYVNNIITELWMNRCVNATKLILDKPIKVKNSIFLMGKQVSSKIFGQIRLHTGAKYVGRS